MWDLSSLTWDQTCTPALKGWSLNHWTAREVPSLRLELNGSEQCRGSLPSRDSSQLLAQNITHILFIAFSYLVV